MRNKKEKRNIFLTGFTSFFTDISSEMIYPVLPFFLTKALGVTPAIVGVIEGISESTASLAKAYFGRVSDKLKYYKSLTIIGYLFSALSKILLFFANAWVFVLTARFLDRIGKGVRTAPRDAIISESVDKEERGKAFGIQRSMDFMGAFLGGLLAYLFLRFLITAESDVKIFKNIFFISIIPAFIGLFFLFFIIVPESLKELKAKQKEMGEKKLNAKLKIFFFATLIFALGNSSNQFLLLRSKDIGVTMMNVILLYLFYNLVTAILSPVFGKLSDKIGKKTLLISGYLLYALVYASFGLITSKFFVPVAWAMYGLYSAMTEGVEKALVSDLSQKENRGFALGLFSTIVGIGVLPASLIAGYLYTYINPASPFLFGAILSTIATFLVVFV